MNFKTFLLFAALPGCALDTFGTGPEVALEVIRDAAPPIEAQANPKPDAGAAALREAEAAAFVDAAPVHPDVSVDNPFGRPANPDAFRGCQMNCPTGCCDPAGFCYTAPVDSACGIGGAACSDCSAFAGHCGSDGVCR